MRALLLGVAIASVGAGCGVLTHGTTSQVSIASRPTGAHAWVNGLYVGVTPIRVMLPSKERHVVVVRAEGYGERRVELLPRVTDAYVVVDSFFAPWGLLLDAISGGWLETTPGRLRLRLDRATASAAAAPTTTSPSTTTSTSTPTSTSTSTPTTTDAIPAGEPLRPPGY